MTSMPQFDHLIINLFVTNCEILQLKILEFVERYVRNSVDFGETPINPFFLIPKKVVKIFQNQN